MNLQPVKPSEDLEILVRDALTGHILIIGGSQPVYADLDAKPFTYYSAKSKAILEASGHSANSGDVHSQEQL